MEMKIVLMTWVKFLSEYKMLTFHEWGDCDFTFVPHALQTWTAKAQGSSSKTLKWTHSFSFLLLVLESVLTEAWISLWLLFTSQQHQCVLHQRKEFSKCLHMLLIFQISLVTFCLFLGCLFFNLTIQLPKNFLRSNCTQNKCTYRTNVQQASLTLFTYKFDSGFFLIMCNQGSCFSQRVLIPLKWKE